MDWWIIALIALPIIALIIALVCFFVKKVLAERRREEEEFRERVNAAYLERIARERAQAVEERRKLNELKEKYKNSPYTVKAAEKFAEMFIYHIKKEKRDVRTTTIECEKYMGAKIYKDVCDRVGFIEARKNPDYGKDLCWGDEEYWYHEKEHYDCPSCGYLNRYGVYHSGKIDCLIDFTRENIRPLYSITEMELFVEAIANKAEEIIRVKYPKDESGTYYTLETRKFKGESTETFGKSQCISIEFKYSASNGFYSAPKEW